MVPHVAKRGHSFIGAGKYYFHDKKAQTSERVAWVETVNLPTTDPAKAMKCMAWTSMNADAIRALAGGSTRGRKAVQGDVYPISLSWHPGEKPTDAHMLAKGLEALAELGMSGHQAVLLRHTDTDHPHLHMLVNLVHPETGVRAKISNDRLKLSEWAQGYEIGQDNVVCHKRIENNERRKNGEYVKYRDAGHDHAEAINQLYQSADSGKAFAASVRSELGLTLATGNKGRVVLVDEAGKIVNLARQLEGQRAKDIRAKLADLDLKALPDAKELADERQKRQEEQKQQRPPLKLGGAFRAANDNRELEAEIIAPRARRVSAGGSFAAAVALDVAWEVEQAAQLEGMRNREEMKIRNARQAWREIAEPMERREALTATLTQGPQAAPSPRIGIEDERERDEEVLRTQKRQQRTEAIEAKAAEVYAVRADIQRRHLDDTRDMEVRHRRQTGIRQDELEPVYGRHSGPGWAWTDNGADMVRRKAVAPRTAPAPRQPVRRPRGPEPGF